MLKQQMAEMQTAEERNDDDPVRYDGQQEEQKVEQEQTIYPPFSDYKSVVGN